MVDGGGGGEVGVEGEGERGGEGRVKGVIVREAEKEEWEVGGEVGEELDVCM